MCVWIILTHLTSLDGRRFDGVLCRDARFKYGHRGIVIDAEEEGDRETFFSGQVGGAVQSRFEDAIGPADTTLVGSIIEPKRTGRVLAGLSYQKAKKSPILTTNVSLIGGAAIHWPCEFSTWRAGTVSCERMVKHS
jgi:hypothetical protein